ncbi:MAG: hypothetical protein WBV36_04700 [Terriglobales bacterium]
MTNPKEATKTPDVLIANAFSVFVFTPLTSAAKTWFDEHIQSESWQWLGASMVVEASYAWGLAEGMRDAGLVLE